MFLKLDGARRAMFGDQEGGWRMGEHTAERYPGTRLALGRRRAGDREGKEEAGAEEQGWRMEEEMKKMMG